VKGGVDKVSIENKEDKSTKEDNKENIEYFELNEGLDEIFDEFEVGPETALMW
jgi:hypothetical protein